LTSSPRNLRGKRGLIVIDEAAFHDDLQELLKAAFALLMWGGEVWIISTHNGVENEFNTLIEDTRAGKTGYELHRVTLSDALEDGLYRRICLKTGVEWTDAGEREWVDWLRTKYGDGAAEELDCIPSRGGVSYFSREVVESRMVRGRPVVRLYLEADFVSWPEQQRVEHVDTWLAAEVLPLLKALPKDAPHCVGYDFGRKSDLSSLCPMTLGKDLVRHVPFAMELGNVPFEQQKQIAFYVLDRIPQLAGAQFDATGNGLYLAEVCFQRYGDIVEQVKISEKWHAEEWAPLRAAIEDGKVTLPADVDLRNDFAAVKRVNGIPKLPTATKAQGAEAQGSKLTRHGDFAVACALAYSVSRKGEAELARWDAMSNI
jgi:phage FluMu gp28-like protein